MTLPVISPEVAVGLRDLVGNTLSLSVCVCDSVLELLLFLKEDIEPQAGADSHLSDL